MASNKKSQKRKTRKGGYVWKSSTKKTNSTTKKTNSTSSINRKSSSRKNSKSIMSALLPTIVN